MTNVMKRCHKIKSRVIPKIVKEVIRKFHKSEENFVRSVNILYKGGIVSKQKCNVIRSSLSICSDETDDHRKHINFMKNIPLPRLSTYENLITKLNEVHTGIA